MASQLPERKVKGQAAGAFSRNDAAQPPKDMTGTVTGGKPPGFFVGMKRGTIPLVVLLQLAIVEMAICGIYSELSHYVNMVIFHSLLC